MYVLKKIVVVILLLLINSGSLYSPIGTVSAAETDEAVDPAEIIAYSGEVYLTQKELDAAFLKIPESERLAFIRDGTKVDETIQSLLKLKSVVHDARKAGYDQSPLVPETVAFAGEKELAENWIMQVMRDAPGADFEVIARENYVTNPDAYRTETVLDVSHILLGYEKRSELEAEQLAELLISRLEADPSIFGDLVLEYSDDPAKNVNGGRYPKMRQGQTVAEFEKAANALTEPGQISGPVETQFGVHIIRLNGRSGNVLPDFEDIKVQAMEEARAQYYAAYQQSYIRKLMKDPIVIPEGAAAIMARRHFGDDLELAPDFDEVVD